MKGLNVLIGKGRGGGWGKWMMSQQKKKKIHNLHDLAEAVVPSAPLNQPSEKWLETLKISNN